MVSGGVYECDVTHKNRLTSYAHTLRHATALAPRLAPTRGVESRCGRQGEAAAARQLPNVKVVFSGFYLEGRV